MPLMVPEQRGLAIYATSKGLSKMLCYVQNQLKLLRLLFWFKSSMRLFVFVQ